jgi:DNA-binding CsgD family transcriptional regulator
MLLSTLAAMEFYLGRPPEAIEALETVRARADGQGYATPNNAEWFADLAEAYVQAGRGEEAEPVVAELERRAERWGGANARALAARARGLIAEDFDGFFERALEHHAERPEPYEEARTQLAFGTRLHRSRRRADARERLRAAEATFERLGARPWLDRARAELRAAGAVKRKAATDPDELTAQEIRVAMAVAAGATNRQVANELFLSPKTIEFHLGRVYRKLDIHSRTELAKLVADGGLGSGPAD